MKKSDQTKSCLSEASLILLGFFHAHATLRMICQLLIFGSLYQDKEQTRLNSTPKVLNTLHRPKPRP